MKEIKKISVEELDLLTQEANSLRGGQGQNVEPFENDIKTNHQSVVAPAPYKGQVGVHGSVYF